MAPVPELPATTDAAAEGQASASEAEAQFTASGPSRSNETGRSPEMQPVSLQPTDETMRGVSGMEPEMMTDVQGNGATEMAHDQECSPVDAIAPVEANAGGGSDPEVESSQLTELKQRLPTPEEAKVSKLPASSNPGGSDMDASSVESHTKVRLNEDMQPSQFQRSDDRPTSEETETTEVTTPQTETEAIDREPGASHNPIVTPDDAPRIIVNNNRGQPIIIDDIDVGSNSDARQIQRRSLGMAHWGPAEYEKNM